MLCPILCLSSLLSVAGKPPIGVDDLLGMASTYQQVERCGKLIHDDATIVQIPCIAPLYAKDFRRLDISSMYGRRLHSILNEYRHHAGIDLPGVRGEKVYAAANGVVKAVAYDAITGKYVKITHSYGFETLYGHLSQQLVRMGDRVRIGSVIGLVGSTGRSTGAHLHYGIKKNNREQDPLPYCYLYLRWLTTHLPSREHVE